METRSMPRFTSFLALLGLTLTIAYPSLSFGADGSQEDSGQLGFQWIDSQHDSATWNKIRAALSDELRPEKSEENEPTYGYKYIRRVGIGANSALVIVGYRFSEHPTKNEYGIEHFRGFSYNLRTGELSQVIDPEHAGYALYMWEWKFVKLARFEPSTLPDVVFTYLTCGECEEEKMLSALHYDSGSQKWQIRQFGAGEPRWWMTRVGLVIDKDISFTDITSYRCLYGLVDLNGDGFDEVAMRCREIDEDEKRKTQLTDSTVFYSLKNGRFSGELVTAKDEQLKLWSVLCQHSTKNKLCKDIPPSETHRQPVNAATP
jgi:hypothetical protein